MKKKINKDIVIIGAGLSGVCAALTCARLGRQVTLIEKNSFPGGIAAILQHCLLCGLYALTTKSPANFLNPGITRQLCAQLAPQQKPLRMGKVWVLPFNPQRLPAVLNDFLNREKKIELRYGVEFKSCICQDNKIIQLTLCRAGRTQQIRPRIVIDAGSGNVIQASGSALALNPDKKRQLAGYTIKLTRVNPQDNLSLRLTYALRFAVTEKKLPQYARFTFLYYGNNQSTVYLKFAVPINYSLTAVQQLSQNTFYFLKKTIADFKHSRIIWTSRQICPRDNAQLNGKYILRTKDILSGYIFANRVVNGAWPIEYWDNPSGPQYRYCEKNYYTIPAESFFSKKIKNLFAAGRSLSADVYAAASLRAAGMCMATGEAAGNIAGSQD